MPRTVATSRITLTSRTPGTSRTPINSFRLPVLFSDLGVTNLWTFRGGYVGTNPSFIKDEVGTSDFTWFNGSALSDIYVLGQYRANLFYDIPDYAISDVYRRIVSPGATSFSTFAPIALEYLDVPMQLFGQTYDDENINGDQRGFSIYTESTGSAQKLVAMFSSNGTDEYIVRSTSAVWTQADVYKFIEVTYDSVAGVKMYVNGQEVAASVVSGSLPRAFTLREQIWLLVYFFQEEQVAVQWGANLVFSESLLGRHTRLQRQVHFIR